MTAAETGPGPKKLIAMPRNSGAIVIEDSARGIAGMLTVVERVLRALPAAALVLATALALHHVWQRRRPRVRARKLI